MGKASIHRVICGAWLAAAMLVTMAWAPSAGAEPPAPPPPVAQQADDAQQAEDGRRPDSSHERVHRAHTSPVVLEKKPISRIRYFLGGLVGSYYGLGIGHAIVGEWGTTGWFYTVSELMSGTVMVIGLYRSFEAAHDPDDGRPRERPSEASQRTNHAMMIGGAIVFTVLRISEIHDLWTRPEVASAARNDDTAFAISPTASDGGLGASLSWSW